VAVNPLQNNGETTVKSKEISLINRGETVGVLSIIWQPHPSVFQKASSADFMCYEIRTAVIPITV
jgi:hypothetical protein